MKIRLDILAPGQPPGSFERDAPVVNIGRDPGCELSFGAGHEGVSWRHARLDATPAGLVLNDLGSTNGTYVNDRRVTGPTPLVPGDMIRLGMRGPQLRLVSAEGSINPETRLEPLALGRPTGTPVAVARPPSSVRLSRPTGPAPPSSDPRPTLAGALSPLRQQKQAKLTARMRAAVGQSRVIWLLIGVGVLFLLGLILGALLILGLIVLG